MFEIYSLMGEIRERDLNFYWNLPGQQVCSVFSTSSFIIFQVNSKNVYARKSTYNKVYKLYVVYRALVVPVRSPCVINKQMEVPLLYTNKQYQQVLKTQQIELKHYNMSDKIRNERRKKRTLRIQLLNQGHPQIRVKPIN